MLHPPLEEPQLVISLTSVDEAGESLDSHLRLYKDDLFAYFYHVLVFELCCSHLDMAEQFVPKVNKDIHFGILCYKLVMEFILNESDLLLKL